MEKRRKKMASRTLRVESSKTLEPIFCEWRQASKRDRGDACAQLTKRVCKLINDAGDELSSRAIHSNIITRLTWQAWATPSLASGASPSLTPSS